MPCEQLSLVERGEGHDSRMGMRYSSTQEGRRESRVAVEAGERELSSADHCSQPVPTRLPAAG